MLDFLEIARSHYFAEFERKRDLNTGVSLSSTLATALAAGLFGLANGSEPIFSTFGSLTLAFTAFGSICLVVAVGHLLLSHVGHGFEHVGSIAAYQNARRTDLKNGTTVEQVDVSTSLSLTTDYAEASAFNQTVNDKKSMRLHKANVGLVWAILATFLAAASLTAGKVAAAVDSKYHAAMPDQDDTPTPPPSRETTDQDRELPNAPPRRIIKESETPDERRG